MDIDKLDRFISEIQNKAEHNMDETLEFFKSEFPKFSKDERDILGGIVNGMALKIADANLPMKTKLYWMVMMKYVDKPVEDNNFVDDINEDIFPRLALGEGINGNQITMIFQELKANGIILGTYELIAEAISTIFQIEYTTAYKDLTEPKRLLKVKKPI